MLINTLEELRMYFPSHNIDQIDTMRGALDNSEHDFLLEKLGQHLWAETTKRYKDMNYDTHLDPRHADSYTPWHKLVTLCQRAVVFDAMGRMADIIVLNVNGSGINRTATTDYNVASKDEIKAFKTSCTQEAHAAINRLLCQLEEWSQTTTPLAADSTDPETPQQTIVRLWRSSRYYYLADGLLINTASMFHRFVDIYDNREKFIRLLPDISYCQDLVIRPELGDTLMDHLMTRIQTAQLTASEERAVTYLRRALALFVEGRNKLFKRPEARDEGMMNLQTAIRWMATHADDFGEAITTAPFYQAPAPVAPTTTAEPCPNQPPTPPAEWENNRPGNHMFVSNGIN